MEHDLFPGDKGTGLIPRDYDAFPRGYYRGVEAVDIPIIPRSEWSERVKDMEANKSRLSDIRLSGNAGQPIPSLDQGQWGYCWAHSTTHAVMLLRAVQNLPYVPLSAFAVAATIKGGRDEGGWGALSLEFAMSRGVPTQAFWPQQDAKLSHGNSACWENAALHKVTEGWADLAVAVYDRDLSFDQEATCLLSCKPVIKDENWWGHSICGMDLVELNPSLDLMDPNRWGVRIWNSWGDSWGDRGTSVLKGRQAISDAATAPRVTTPSMS